MNTAKSVCVIQCIQTNCDLHKIEFVHTPQLFILLAGNILIPRAITFLVGKTITKVSKNVNILTKWYIPEAIYTNQSWP